MTDPAQQVDNNETVSTYSEVLTPKVAKTVNNDTNGDKETKKQVKYVSFINLFRFANSTDIILLTLGIICGLGSGIIQSVQVIIFGDILDAFNIDSSESESARRSAINKVALRFVWIAIGALVLGYGQVGLFSITASRQARRLKQHYVNAILRQEIAWFDVNRPTQLSTKIAESTAIIQDGMGRKAGDGFMFFGMFVSGIIIGLVEGWLLGIVLLAFLPVIATAAYFMMKIISTAVDDATANYAKAGAIAQEALRNIRTVFAFNASNREADKYDKYLIETEKSGIKKGTSVGIAIGLMFFSVFLAYAVGMYFGAYLVSRDQLECAADNSCCTGSDCYSGGRVITVFFSVIMGAMALGQAGPSMQAIISARAAAYDIHALIDSDVNINATVDEGETLLSVEGNITISNVAFSYPARLDVPLYTDFSLDISKGEKIALVGASGCGKSTIIQLIERFYDPIRGTIALDGHDIRKLNVRWLRQQIGLVGQEPVLFKCSIAENISYGKPGVTMEEIKEAAKMANAYDFIMKFPDGFETDVGEKGGQLSGGQKQRIAIARAIVRDPAILLLDEATSALDTESERIVQESLDSLLLAKKRTTIIVAHRLSTIRDSDRIAVIDQGVVAEIGSHDELIKISGGHYQKLVNVQMQSSKKDEENAKADKERLMLATGDHTVKLEETVTIVDETITHEKKDDTVVVTSVVNEEEKAYSVNSNRIWSMNKMEWPYMVIGGIGSLLTGATFPVWGILLTEIMAMFFKVEETRSAMRKEALEWAGAFIALGVAYGVGNVMQNYGFAVVAERLTRRLRSSGFRAILQQEIGWFDDEKHSSGALVSQLASDTAKVQSVTGEFLNRNIATICTLGVGIVIAFVNSWKLSLVMLAVFPLLGFGFYVQAQLMNGTSSKADSPGDLKAAALVSEAISSSRTVVSYGLEKLIDTKYTALLSESSAQQLKSGSVSGFGFGFSQSSIFFVNALIFWYGGKLVVEGEVSFKEMMMVILVLMLSAFGLGVATQNVTESKAAKTAISNVFSVIDRVPLINIDAPGEEIDHVEGNIQFKNVNFSYPSRPFAPIYQGYTLNINSGETVALVGASGGGKSTAVSLLERFYDPNSGIVALDGKDIKTLNLKWLRQNISLVSQEPALFSGSVAENISFGKSNATREEIVEAAKLANAHNFISLFPDGYDTELGDNGMQVSGGQKQRIAIARAIIRDPKVLVLDEATSALDTESEAVVQESLDALLKMKKRTTIIIAHRLSTIRDADKIAVVFGGKIVELGTHDELLQIRNGHYAQLVSKQSHS